MVRFSPLSSPTSHSLVLAPLLPALALPQRVDSTPIGLILRGACDVRARHIRARGRGHLCVEDTGHGIEIGIGTLFETRTVEAEVGEAGMEDLLHGADLVLAGADTAARHARVVPSCGAGTTAVHHGGGRLATNEDVEDHPALSVRILIGVAVLVPCTRGSERQRPVRGRVLARAAFRGVVIRRIRARHLTRARALGREVVGVRAAEAGAVGRGVLVAAVLERRVGRALLPVVGIVVDHEQLVPFFFAYPCLPSYYASVVGTHPKFLCVVSTSITLLSHPSLRVCGVVWSPG